MRVCIYVVSDQWSQKSFGNILYSATFSWYLVCRAKIILGKVFGLQILCNKTYNGPCYIVLFSICYQWTVLICEYSIIRACAYVQTRCGWQRLHTHTHTPRRIHTYTQWLCMMLFSCLCQVLRVPPRTTAAATTAHTHTPVRTRTRTHTLTLCILCREQIFHSASGWAARTDKCSCQRSVQAKEEVSDETNNTLRILTCGVSPGGIKGHAARKGQRVSGKSNLMCHVEYFTKIHGIKNPGPSEQQHVEKCFKWGGCQKKKKSNWEVFSLTLIKWANHISLWAVGPVGAVQQCNQCKGWRLATLNSKTVADEKGLYCCHF